MKAFIMKNWIYCLVGLFFFATGSILGFKIGSPHYINNNIITNISYPTNIIPCPIIYALEKVVTNYQLSNQLEILITDNTAPFVGIQKKDNFDVTKGDQSAKFKLKPWFTEKNWIIGFSGIFNQYGIAYGVDIGYQYSCGGVIIEPYYGATNNWGGSISVFGRF